MNHTSRTLTLEENPPECWCAHSESDHLVRWVENKGEFVGLELGIWYPDVGCQICLEAQLGASRLQVEHNLAIARSLARQRPEAVLSVRLLEFTQKMLKRRDEGASAAEMDELIRQHEKLREEAENEITFRQQPDKGNA